LKRGAKNRKTPGPARKSLAELESLKFAQAKLRIHSVILRYYPTCKRLKEAEGMKRLYPEGEAGGRDDGGLEKFAEDEEEDEEGLPFIAPSSFSSRSREPAGPKDEKAQNKKRKAGAAKMPRKTSEEEGGEGLGEAEKPYTADGAGLAKSQTTEKRAWGSRKTLDTTSRRPARAA